MIARSRAVAAPGGRLIELACQPPLTLRQIAAARPEVCALCLVGTAAGPLAGDDLTLRLEVLAGTSASLRAAGAAIAQGRADGAASSLRLQAALGTDAALRADPGALIVRAGARIAAHVEIDPGRARAGGVARAGLPRCSPDATGGRPPSRDAALGRDPRGCPAAASARRPDQRGVVPRCLHARRSAGAGLGFAVRQGRPGRTIIARPTAVAQQLADDAVLVTVLADDAATAQREVAGLCDQVRRGCA